MGKGGIWVITFRRQGILPLIELSKKIASTGYKTSLVIPSKPSSSVASHLRQHPRVDVLELSVPPPPAPQQSEMVEALKKLLSKRPSFVVIDIKMRCPSDMFQKFHIPAVAFFTSGACAAAMEYATWKAHYEDIQAGKVCPLLELLEHMALTYSNLKPVDAPGFLTPPGPEPLKRVDVHQPPWLEMAERSIGLMFNTCDNLEGPLMDYIATQIGKHVWGVGPFSRDLHWNDKGAGKVEAGRSFVSKLRGLFCCGSGVKVGFEEGEVIDENRQSHRSKYKEVLQWLDLKPKGSVIYVSFGRETGLTMEENQQLARVIEKSTRSFIWKAANRGIVKPLILSELSTEKDFFLGLDWEANRDIVEPFILSHPSTGGFLSNCEWNSTAEALVHGLPILAWPKKGDQFYNAELVVSHLKTGYLLVEDISGMVQEEDIAQGIEKLMEDVEIRARVTGLRTEFEKGFPESSVAALNASVESAILL